MFSLPLLYPVHEVGEAGSYQKAIDRKWGGSETLEAVTREREGSLGEGDGMDDKE